MIFEKAVEVFAPLRGQNGLVLLRLEAMRSMEEGPRYEVVVYRREKITVRPVNKQAGRPAAAPRESQVWTDYETKGASVCRTDAPKIKRGG
jgi:hypothetical protein